MALAGGTVISKEEVKLSRQRQILKPDENTGRNFHCTAVDTAPWKNIELGDESRFKLWTGESGSVQASGR